MSSTQRRYCWWCNKQLMYAKDGGLICVDMVNQLNQKIKVHKSCAAAARAEITPVTAVKTAYVGKGNEEG